MTKSVDLRSLSVRGGRAWAIGVVLMSLMGCDTAQKADGPRAPTDGVASIDELKLIGFQAGINVDNDPGPDAFGAKVFALRRDRNKSAAIGAGRLEIVMLGGVVEAGKIRTTEPHEVWSFTPAQLQAHRRNAVIGVFYEFVIAWKKDKPMPDQITVVARWVPETGQAVYSMPLSLAIVTR